MKKGQTSSPKLRRLESGEKQEENAQKAEVVPQISNNLVNSDYKYDDYDMQLFLSFYAQIAEAKTKIITIALEPIAAEQLSVVLEGDNTKQIPRNVIIACNLGRKHWVGIGIKITNKKIEVEYMDSMPNNGIPNAIIDQLKKYYGENIIIRPVNRLIQSDSVSCGPLTLKNLLNFATGEIAKPQRFSSKESVIPTREQQINDIALHDDAFANKQLNDRSTVAPNERYDNYVTQLNLKNYTNAETEQITNLVEQYKKIENPAIRTEIFDVFNNDSTKVHKEYFSRIRNAFSSLRNKQELSNGDYEGLDGVMQIMFGINLDTAKKLNKDDFKKLPTRILSYDALLNLFPKMVIEEESLKTFLSELKNDIKISKEHLEKVTDKLRVTHALYLNIVRTIRSSDTWAEKITTENVLFIFSALTITISAAMQESEDIGLQMVGKAISWLGVIAAVGVTIPQTQVAFFEDFSKKLKNIKDELEDFPETLEMLEVRFKSADLKRNLNWQRAIAVIANAFTLSGVILNLTYNNFNSKIVSILGAGLASTIGQITSVHHIGKIKTSAKKIESIDSDILHMKIKELKYKSEQKDKIIEEKNKLIEELRNPLKKYEESKGTSSTHLADYARIFKKPPNNAEEGVEIYRRGKQSRSTTRDDPSRPLFKNKRK